MKENWGTIVMKKGCVYLRKKKKGGKNIVVLVKHLGTERDWPFGFEHQFCQFIVMGPPKGKTQAEFSGLNVKFALHIREREKKKKNMHCYHLLKSQRIMWAL